MTPQLQQAIRMLQMSAVELQEEIQEALDSNLMLEAEEGQGEGENLSRDEVADEASQERSDKMESSEIPDELAVDSQWEDTYDSIAPAGGVSNREDDERPLEYSDQSSMGLHEHLEWQMRLTPLSETDQLIAEAIIDAVDDDGLLGTSTEELLQTLQNELPELEEDEVIAVLHLIQHFDPPGIAACNLRECLLLQLEQMEPAPPLAEQAMTLLQEHFDTLAGKDYNQIKRRMKLNDEQLLAIVQLIQSLNPRPGAQISEDKTEYIMPDILVRKHKGRWRVELNPETAPKLRINSLYAGMIKQVNNSSDSTTMKNHLQEARWFLKSLQSRNDTLLKVATSIVEHQQGFLEHGDIGMKPMVLAQIADELGMHESTISRVTTRKYMHTPRGVYELKYFFSSHVATSSGGECSSTAIRALIKQIIGEENPAKPLSDSKIANMLVEQGINVARRTIAKYREAMAIPPSNERKRLA